ncbi:MAG: hypothetical protein GY794_04150 [bacterium]|nr:hypothetical protein [bacterium]
MTSKERILAAIAHKQPDRTPITFDAESEVYASLYEHLGLETKEALFDRLGVDTWMVLPGNFIYPADQNALSEKTSIWGYRSKVTAYTGGEYDEICFNPLAGKDTIADINAHNWPTPNTLDFNHYATEAGQHSDRAVIGVFTWGAYFIASMVRGLGDLMMDFAMRRDYAEHLIRTIGEICKETLTKMLESHGDGIDIVYMADDYCSQRGPLFSPDDFAHFVVPYLTDLVEIAHQHNKAFMLHCCGAVRPLLPMIVDAGVDMLEPIQTSATGMDPASLKKDFGQDLCFYGGMDLQNTLCRGNRQQVSDEVKRLIDTLGDNGGYILGPGHTYIQVDTPIENILTMYDTAQTYCSNR